jgi:glycosyltransferase involved in cell wall biosynthesis
VRNGVDGLLLPNEPAEWVQAVLNLVQDPPRRERMATAAHERALELSY